MSLSSSWYYTPEDSSFEGSKDFEQGTFVKHIYDDKQPHLFFVARVLKGLSQEIWHDLVRLGFKGITNRYCYVLVLFPLYHYDKGDFGSLGSHFIAVRGSEIDSFKEISLDEARDIAKESKDYKVIRFLQNDNVVDVLNSIPTNIEESIRFEFLRYSVLKILAEDYLVVPLEYHRYFNHKGYGYIHAYENEHRLDKLIHKYYKLKYKDDNHGNEYSMRIAESVVNELDSSTLARLKEETYNTNKLTCSLNVAESFYRIFMGEHYKRSSKLYDHC